MEIPRVVPSLPVSKSVSVSLDEGIVLTAAMFLTSWGSGIVLIALVSGIVLIALGLGIVRVTFIVLKRIGVRDRSHHIGCWNRTQHVSRFVWNNCCEHFFRENLKGWEKNANGEGSDLKHTFQCFATFSLKPYPSNFWEKKTRDTEPGRSGPVGFHTG